MHVRACVHVYGVGAHALGDEDWCAYADTYFGFLNDVCKLSHPDKAVLGCNQEETIATVQRRSSRLDQPRLYMPTA